MPVSEQLLQGFELMLLGMGIVFTFLVVLVVVMNGMSRLAQAIEGPLPAPEPRTPSTAQTAEDTALVAVISAAIARYRASHNK